MEQKPWFTRNVSQYRSAGAPQRQGRAAKDPRIRMQQQRSGTVATQREPLIKKPTMHMPPQAMRTAPSEHTQPQHPKKRSVWILDKVIALCVWMLFFGVPLFFLNVAYQGVAFEKQYYFYTWTFIGGAAFVIRSMMGVTSIIRRTPLDIPIAVLWCVVVISALFSVDRYHSAFGFFGTPVMGVVSLTAVIVAYYIIVSTFTRARMVQIWWAVIASGALVTAWSFAATMRFIGQDILAIIPGTLTGTFSGLTVYLGMLLPFLILTPSVIGNTRTKLVTGIAAILIILNGMTLSALYGYVQWYVILGAVGLLVAFMISRLVRSTQEGKGMAIGVFLALMFLFLWGQPLVTRIAIQPEPVMTHALSWTIAKGALSSRPLLGSGPGTYGYHFSLFAPSTLNKNGDYDIRAFVGRGMVMDGIATIGILGVIALCIVFFTYIGTAWIACVHDKRDESLTVATLGFFIASVVAAVYSLVWAIDGMIMLYGVLLAAACMGGIALSSERRAAKTWTFTFMSSPQHALSFAFLSIVGAVLAVFGFVTLGKMFIADVYARAAFAAYRDNDTDRATAFFQKTINLNGKEGRYYILIAQYGLDLAMREARQPTDQQNRDAIATFIVSAAGAASMGCDLMPNDAFAHEIKGIVLENSGGYVQSAADDALASYQRAGALEPHNPQFDIAIGRMQLVKAQTKTGEQAGQERKALVEDAKKSFEAARDKTTFLYGNSDVSLFAPAHYYFAVTQEALGDIDSAITAMDTALAVSQNASSSAPSDDVKAQSVNYAFHLARMLQVRHAEGDIEQAERILQNIIAVRTNDVDATIALGLLYEKDGKKDAAIAQYEKVLTFLPEDDTESRDTVQKMIDAVRDGRGNTAAQHEDGPARSVVPAEFREDQTSHLALPRVVIVHDTASEEHAAKGGDILRSNDYEVETRHSENASTGVTVLYRDEIHLGAAQELANLLRAQFPEITVSHNDSVLASYAEFDILVDIGQDEP